MKKVLITAALLIALVAASRSAFADCIQVDDDHTPVAVLSGRVTQHHKVVDRDLRAANGPFLKLDAPLQVDLTGCRSFTKVVILNAAKLRNNQHTTIAGTLGRFGSALVDSPIFIGVK
jgi:hypothetical protein